MIGSDEGVGICLGGGDALSPPVAVWVAFLRRLERFAESDNGLPLALT